LSAARDLGAVAGVDNAALLLFVSVPAAGIPKALDRGDESLFE
jgi:hypothetical protein